MSYPQFIMRERRKVRYRTAGGSVSYSVSGERVNPQWFVRSDLPPSIGGDGPVSALA